MSSLLVLKTQDSNSPHLHVRMHSDQGYADIGLTFGILSSLTVIDSFTHRITSTDGGG